MTTFWRWEENFHDLCDAPLNEVQHTALDSAHPALDFHRAWITFPRNQGYACRSGFQPSRMPKLLPWMMICDVVALDDLLEFEVRLHGTKFAQMTYGDHTGKQLKDFIHSDCLSTRRAQFADAVRTNRARYAAAPIRSKGEYRTNATVGIFPVWDDRQGAQQLFVIAAPDNIEVRNLL